MRAILLVVALSFCGYSFAESQPIPKDVPPVSGKAETSSKKNNPPNVKQEITVSLPSSINMNLSGKLDVISQNEQASTYEEPSKWTDPITWFTLVIAIANIMLWIKTGSLVTEATRASGIAKESADASKLAANAAQSTAQAAIHEFIASHRPKLILRDATTEQNMGELIAVNFIISNIGGTPATIIEGALRVNVFKGWQFEPDNLPVVTNGGSDIDGKKLMPGEQVHLSFTSPTLRWSGGNDTCHTFLEPEYGMFFSGQIIYEDQDGIRRSMGFRRKYFSEQHRFLATGNNEPHYEYQD